MASGKTLELRDYTPEPTTGGRPKPDNGELVEMCRLMPGDALKNQGEWLDIVAVDVTDFGMLVTCDNPIAGAKPRQFIGGYRTVRRARRHAPTKPTISHKAES